MRAERRQAIRKNLQDSVSLFRKVGDRLLLSLRAAETARLPEHWLDPYQTEQPREIKSASLPCLSSCLFACVRPNLGRMSTLDALLLHPASARGDLADSLFLADPDPKTGVVTL